MQRKVLIFCLGYPVVVMVLYIVARLMEVPNGCS